MTYFCFYSLSNGDFCFFVMNTGHHANFSVLNEWLDSLNQFSRCFYETNPHFGIIIDFFNNQLNSVGDSYQ
jgi:hypothetical protein